MNGNWKIKKSHNFYLFNTTIFYEQNFTNFKNIPHYFPIHKPEIVQSHNRYKINQLIYIMGPISNSIIIMVIKFIILIILKQF